MKALISGEASVAFVPGKPPVLRLLDGRAIEAWHASDALRAFDGCSDVFETSVSTSEEVDQLLRSAWASDRALKLALLLLDPEEPEEELTEYAECLEELIQDASVRDSVERRLMSAAFPIMVELNRILRACQSSPITTNLISRIFRLQGPVGQVRSAFDNVPAAPFGGQREKALCREALISDGAFRTLALALVGGEDISFLRIQIASRHGKHRDAVLSWIASLQPGLKKARKRREALSPDEPDQSDTWDDEDERQPSHAAYEQVRAQQIAIVQKLKAFDLPGARRLTNDLIRSQETNSTKKQIAKSLSALAQQAKKYDILELQLEWSRWASRVNPFDPKAFGHYADALLSGGRLAEAQSAFDEVERAGDPLFAETGRARVLRSLGRPKDARQLYLQAARSILVGLKWSMPTLGPLSACATWACPT